VSQSAFRGAKFWQKLREFCLENAQQKGRQKILVDESPRLWYNTVMFRIWAKTTKGDKITRSEIFAFDGKYAQKQFSSCLSVICDQMDLPAPVVLKCHIRNFSAFNITKFKPDDFVESVDFDVFLLEYAADK